MKDTVLMHRQRKSEGKPMYRKSNYRIKLVICFCVRTMKTIFDIPVRSFFLLFYYIIYQVAIGKKIPLVAV